MIKKKDAIIDNSCLRVLYHLKILRYLYLLYNEVLIPREVEKEFLSATSEETQRYAFLSEFYRENYWFKKCNFYQDDLVKVFSANNKLHRGEAGIFVQNQILSNVYQVILDDKEARKFAQSSNVSVIGTLAILATFEIKWNICDYYDSIEILIKKHQARYSNAIIKEVYNSIKYSISQY